MPVCLTLHLRRTPLPRRSSAHAAASPAAAQRYARRGTRSHRLAAASQRDAPGAQPDPEVEQTTAADAEAPCDSTTVAAGSVLGAVALITGSSVGAGILALPSVAAPAGFVPVTGALLGCWALLTLEAIVMAEVNVRVGCQETGEYQATTLAEMTRATLGETGGTAATAVYMLNSYTLLMAYICKGSEVVSALAGPGISQQQAGLAFAATMCAMLYSGDTGTIDKINRLLTGMLLVAFGYIVVGGASEAEFSHLTSTMEWGQAAPALPILFLALVYHDLVPVLCSYLEGDLPRIKRALMLGGAVPLAMFVSWNAVALLMVSPDGMAVDPLQLLDQLSLPMMGAVVSTFGLLAIATSFIGTFLGLSSYLQVQGQAVSETLATRASEARGDAALQPPIKEAAFFCTILPPCLLAWNNSDSFLPASEFAGAYGSTTLYALLPPLMAWSLMNKNTQGGSADRGAPLPRSMPFQVFGGGSRWVLASMTSAAAGMEAFKVALDSGLSLDQVLTIGQSATTSVVYAFPELASAPMLFDALPWPR